MLRKYILKSSIHTARISRLIAKAIDLFIVFILALIFYPFGVIISLFYLAICDSLYGGQSIGKKAIGFAVISLEDGKPCSTKQSFVRNLPLIIPISFSIIPPWGLIITVVLLIPLVLLEIYLLFRLDSGHRLGDVMADTTVIGNDPDRIDLRKAQEGWFPQGDKGMSPVNSTMLN